VALAQLLIFTHAAGKNALHGARVFGVLGRPRKQVVQAGAGPELPVEFVVEPLNPLDGNDLSEYCSPTGNGNPHQ
jgi:hypothetical protein